ncbi:MAG TPA: family 1 glycosylhydrolase [Aeromicrobium sp.]|nr:family 1 glycosylhydrolase [Aeromicrobium sp.]
MPNPLELAARLPEGFALGAATAALQIEGAADQRGRCGWDEFADAPGRIADGSTPAVTCDHVHRLDEDLDLLKGAGLDSYRFSISWPRVQPTGSGPVDAAGLDFYDRLVDGLLARGISPMATLYHWDTPLPVEQAGGWTNRDTAKRLGEFAAIMGERLGDRVPEWVTVNEAATVVMNGYGLGVHAPGEERLFKAGAVARNMLLGHGYAVQGLRSAGVSGRIGITNTHTPCTPAEDTRKDKAMAGLLDFIHNRLFADPVLLGRSPEVPKGLGMALGFLLRRVSHMSKADLAIISEPIDFYGLNYYFPSLVAAGADLEGNSPDGESEAAKDLPFRLLDWPGLEKTGFGWPIDPDGLRRLAVSMVERYGDRLPPVVITEGGASFEDKVGADGVVNDTDRIKFLDGHLNVAADLANGAVPGFDLQGYCVWSLMDNWEWAAGFTQRFGLVHVDFESLARTPKASYGWIRDVQSARGRVTS